MAVAFLIWGSLDNPAVSRVTQDGTASREDPKERQATSDPWYSDPSPETLCSQGSKLTLTSVTPHPRTAESMRPVAVSPKAVPVCLGRQPLWDRASGLLPGSCSALQLCAESSGEARVLKGVIVTLSLMLPKSAWSSVPLKTDLPWEQTFPPHAFSNALQGLMFFSKVRISC